MSRPDLALWLSAAVLAVVLAAALFAPQLAPYGPKEQDIAMRLRPPAPYGRR